MRLIMLTIFAVLALAACGTHFNNHFNSDTLKIEDGLVGSEAVIRNPDGTINERATEELRERLAEAPPAGPSAAGSGLRDLSGSPHRFIIFSITQSGTSESASEVAARAAANVTSPNADADASGDDTEGEDDAEPTPPPAPTSRVGRTPDHPLVLTEFGEFCRRCGSSLLARRDR